MRLSYAAASLALTFLLAVAGCASSINYDSQFDRRALQGLQGKPVLLARFYSRDNAILDAKSLDTRLSNAVRSLHKARFLSAFSRIFDIRDVSEQVQAGHRNDATLVKSILKHYHADAAFIVANSYGYEMEDHPLSDPSQIHSYDFASDTVLYDREGHVIWRFYGKASLLPNLLQMLSPKNLLRSVAGLDPSSQTVAANMVDISDTYSGFLSWMLQRDLSGIPNKNYFIDYPKERRGKVQVFPADSESYVPFVRGYDPLKRP
jgi:hypothetical protein